MVIDLLFQYKIKDKNPAGATTDNGATSIAMETLSEEQCGPGHNLRESSGRPQNMRGIILEWFPNQRRD
jgi:hypothetical protein